MWLVGVLGKEVDVPSAIIEALSSSPSWNAASLTQQLSLTLGTATTMVSLTA